MLYMCEMCAEDMSKEDHDFCDICPKCLIGEFGLAEEW